MRTSIRGILIAGAASAALTSGTLSAQAGGFAIREQSAVGQGSSFAGEGTPGMGLSAMFWNPAAVTQSQGMWGEAHGALITAHANETATTGTSPALLPTPGFAFADDIARTGGVTASYSAYKLNPQWFVGMSITTPFGLATGTSPSWAGQQLGTRAQIMSIDVNPIVGYKVNDWLSVGAGPRVLWLQGRLNAAILPPAAIAIPGVGNPISNLKSDDIGWGFSAGATITPNSWTEIAIGYRSQVDLTLDGRLAFPAFSPTALAVVGAASPVRAAFLAAVAGTSVKVGNGKTTLPDEVTLGARFRVNEAFTLLGTVEWTNWSTVQTLPFTYTSGPALGATATTVTFNYRDGWFFSGGGEYQLSPMHTLRAGIAYEVSPVRDAVRDPILLDNNRWWFSAGLTSKINKTFTLDFGYSFIWVGDTGVTVGPLHPDFATIAPNTLVTTSSPYVHIFAASLRWKFDQPLPALITKG